MGSPLSSILSDIVMDDIITRINTSSFNPFLVLRYVDDLFLIIHEDSTLQLLNFVNNLEDGIAFTVEVESEQRSINFLDTTVYRNLDNSLHTIWYQKPLSTYPRLTNFYSSTNLSTIRNIAFNTFYRALSLTHHSHRSTAINKAYKILSANNYPTKFTTPILLSAQNKITSHSSPSPLPNNNPDPPKHITFPYTNHPTNAHLKRAITEYNPNLKLANYCINKASSYHSYTKTKYPPHQRVDMVYKIPCSSCDLSYVGNTKQTLGARVKQHNYDLKTTKTTGVTKHHEDTGHIPNFHEAHPIHYEPISHKRFVAENIHILANNTFNLKDDVTLSRSYSSLIKQISHK